MAERIAKPEFKARMTVRLAVAGAFHTDFMQACFPSAFVTAATLRRACHHTSCMDPVLEETAPCASAVVYFPDCVMAAWAVSSCMEVNGDGHTSCWVQPAVKKLQAALDDTVFRTPRIPVISNVDAQPHANPIVIRSILARQVALRSSQSVLCRPRCHTRCCVMSSSRTKVQFSLATRHCRHGNDS